MNMRNRQINIASGTPGEAQAVDRIQHPFVQRISEYRENPLLFVKEQIRPKVISNDQKRFLDAVGLSGSHVSASTGTAVGITAACAWIVLWFLLCQGNGKLLCTATKYGQIINVLIPEIKKWIEKLDADISGVICVDSDRIYLRGKMNERFAFWRNSGVGTAEHFQGVGAENLLFLFCDPGGIPQECFDASMGCMCGNRNRWVCAGSPILASGPFYDTQNNPILTWTRLRFSSLDSPFCDPVFAKEIAKKYGKNSNMYRVRVLGKFPLNPGVHPSPDASAGVGGATRCSRPE
jgi:hypothetical protein